MLKLLDRNLGKITFLLWDIKEGGTRIKEYSHLQRHQYLSRNEIYAIQTEKLNKLLKHAWFNSQWYRGVMEDIQLDPTKPVTLSDLQRFPVTTKTDIRENLECFVSRKHAKSDLKKAKTGGSTGTSLNLFFDEHCQQLRNAAQMYSDSFSGWKPGARIAAVWGNPPIATTLKQKARSFLLERMIYLDTMNLSHESMNAFVERWREFEPDIIFGHAHSIFIFAQYLIKNHISDLCPQGIVATSMMLLDHERQVIEQAFGAKVTNRYGCEEVGLIGVECEKHSGMHINTSHIILEVLDGNDKPVVEGRPGKLVLTDLNNYGMPLIRYRVEDVGVVSDRQCSCGRTTPVLERLEGRVADFLKKPDGSQVAGVSLVERTLTKVQGIEQMQLVQNDLYEIKINRVKGSEYTSATDPELLREFREVFDEEIKLTIHDVDKIPQESSGKYRFSICKV